MPTSLTLHTPDLSRPGSPPLLACSAFSAASCHLASRSWVMRATASPPPLLHHLPHLLFSFLPSGVQILGYARSSMTDEQLRERLRPGLPKDDPKKVWTRSVGRCGQRVWGYARRLHPSLPKDGLTRVWTRGVGGVGSGCGVFFLPAPACQAHAMGIRDTASSPLTLPTTFPTAHPPSPSPFSHPPPSPGPLPTPVATGGAVLHLHVWLL